MKLLSSLAAVAALGAAIPAVAAPVTLDFEDQESFLSLNYAGATHGLGANGALLALANDGLADTPSGNYFVGNPSGTTVMFATEPLAGERAAITTDFGFSGAVQFFFSAAVAGVVHVRDIAGVSLGSFDFSANSTGEQPFDTWVQGLISFQGIGYSIDFTDATGALFDDVSTNVVPIPAAIVLLPFGLAALGLAGRRRKAVAAA